MPDLYNTGVPGRWIDGLEQTAPVANTNLVTVTVSVGKIGLIYGFQITMQESNDVKIIWTSGGVAKSFRISFNTAGTISDTELVAINQSSPADSGTSVSIQNVSAAATGKIYQARLLYAER